MHSIAKLAQLRSDLKISVVWFICQIVVGNIVNVITLFKFCRNAHDQKTTFVLRRRNEDYVAIAPLDPPDTGD